MTTDDGKQGAATVNFEKSVVNGMESDSRRRTVKSAYPTVAETQNVTKVIKYINLKFFKLNG